MLKKVFTGIRPPPDLEQGLEMMEKLKSKLSKRALEKREEQLDQLKRFMENTSKSGGIYSPEFRSFENHSTKDRTRVDFELWAGAFGLLGIIIILIIFFMKYLYRDFLKDNKVHSLNEAFYKRLLKAVTGSQPEPYFKKVYGNG